MFWKHRSLRKAAPTSRHLRIDVMAIVTLLFRIIVQVFWKHRALRKAAPTSRHLRIDVMAIVTLLFRI
ncbi:hypothetical protein, partial [Pseudoalteromonas piscicida]|uniref:hypothetical protein n=1 Tax=Pseudoalteromonas piscicida TaxID=43662 RepID=UPI0030AE713E